MIWQLAHMTLEALISLLCEYSDPVVTVTHIEWPKVAMLFKQLQKNKDLLGLLFEKFEAQC